MTILKKIVKNIREKRYKKWKNTPCKECGSLTWKYSFAPYIIKKRKGMLVGRVCGKCSYKDRSARFISSDMRIDENTKLEYLKNKN